MKTRVMIPLIAAAMLFSWSSAFGQAPLQFGVRAGLNISNWDVDHEFVDFDSRTSFAGGGFVVFTMPGVWAIQAEALYVPKGATSTVQATDENGEPLGEVDLIYRADYLEIPVLARITLGASPVHILAGPSVALKLTSKLTADDVPGRGDYEEDLDWVASSDFGLVLGAGVALPTEFGAVVIDGRYTWGLSNINDDTGAEFKNNAFLISAGVSF